jgi:uncharacterized RDD family membrane protein YckC
MNTPALFCNQCGQQNSAAAGFCTRCGGTLAPVPAAMVSVPAPAAVSPYGGFWIRVLAKLIDSVVMNIIMVPIALIVFLVALASGRGFRDSGSSGALPVALIGLILLFVILAVVAVWLYEAFATSSSWQGTLGKKVLRLKVTDLNGQRISFGRATGRFFAKMISGWLLNIGFIMVGFTERKQGLHDMIAGTLVWRG